MKIKKFTDYSDGSETIDGTSSAMPINYPEYKGTPYSIQITSSSSAVGTIQGLIYVDATDTADASALWQDLDGGTISGNGVFPVYAPVTHVRIKLTSGTCSARIIY